MRSTPPLSVTVLNRELKRRVAAAVGVGRGEDPDIPAGDVARGHDLVDGDHRAVQGQAAGAGKLGDLKSLRARRPAYGETEIRRGEDVILARGDGMFGSGGRVVISARHSDGLRLELSDDQTVKVSVGWLLAPRFWTVALLARV